MSYYAIGIGYIGAKCIEALTHLAATGMVPGGNLHTLLIYSDENSTITRVKGTIDHYTNCKEKIKLGNIDFLKTRIIPGTFEFKYELQRTLGQILNYSQLNSEKSDLFNILYSRVERDALLRNGFHNYPSIGTALLSCMKQNDDYGQLETLFKNIEGSINNSDDGSGSNRTKVFLFGSTFEGAGVSCFLRIACILHDRFKSVPIGGALILPYLQTKANDSLTMTQAILKYYYRKQETIKYDAVYLLGNEFQSDLDSHARIESQKNEPHFIELFAALAAIDFFKRDKSDQDNKYFLLTRKTENRLEWEDLPDGEQGKNIKHKINHLTRFAIAYQYEYATALSDIQKNGKSYRFPWFVNFFKREDIAADEIKTKWEQLDQYCRTFTQWLPAIQQSGSIDQFEINLINLDNLSKSNYSKAFDNLMLPESRSRSYTIADLFERMSSIKVSDKDASGFGKFVYALYKQCGPEANK